MREAENVVGLFIPLDLTLEAHKGRVGPWNKVIALSVGPLCPVTNCFFHLGFRHRSVNNSCCYQLQGEFTIPVGDPGLVETSCI